MVLCVLFVRVVVIGGIGDIKCSGCEINGSGNSCCHFIGVWHVRVVRVVAVVLVVVKQYCTGDYERYFW